MFKGQSAFTHSAICLAQTFLFLDLRKIIQIIFFTLLSLVGSSRFPHKLQAPFKDDDFENFCRFSFLTKCGQYFLNNQLWPIFISDTSRSSKIFRADCS